MTYLSFRYDYGNKSLEIAIFFRSDTAYTWENTFMHNRLPWNNASSVDNLYAGLVTHLYRIHGGFSWAKGFWHTLPQLVSRAPSSKLDNQVCVCVAGCTKRYAPQHLTVKLIL